MNSFPHQKEKLPSKINKKAQTTSFFVNEGSYLCN
jgi:hypothetical protein